ncbi:MAG: hypothetical protein ABSF23_05450 [Terracidiphilus sp.]|jgi:hypothetical protein
MVPKGKKPARAVRLEVHRLKGKRKGALLQERTTIDDGRVVAYSLAYINHRRCPVDNGRVLAYDNSHGYHHRHFMGKMEAVRFSTYAALVERFIAEVHDLWRIEDEEG